MRNWLTKLRRQGLACQSAVLLAATLAVYAMVAPVAASLGGSVGLAAAAVAAGLCLLGAELALVACRLLRNPKYVLHAMLLGMLLRMAIPLAPALAIQFQGGALANAGLLVYLGVVYPVTLFVETALSLPSGEVPHHRSDVSANVAL